MLNTLQPGYDGAAKLSQAGPSPAKPIQIKLLGLAWFYSSDSGLINGLRRNPNKNFSPRSVLASRLSPERMISLRRLCQRGAISNFCRKIVSKVRFLKCPAAPAVGQFEISAFDPVLSFQISPQRAENAEKRPLALQAEGVNNCHCHGSGLFPGRRADDNVAM